MRLIASASQAHGSTPLMSGTGLRRTASPGIWWWRGPAPTARHGFIVFLLLTSTEEARVAASVFFKDRESSHDGSLGVYGIVTGTATPARVDRKACALILSAAVSTG